MNVIFFSFYACLVIKALKKNLVCFTKGYMPGEKSVQKLNTFGINITVTSVADLTNILPSKRVHTSTQLMWIAFPVAC